MGTLWCLSGSVGEMARTAVAPFYNVYVCVCMYVMFLPTPLAPTTLTRNPNVTLSVTGCHTPCCEAGCTHTHKVLTFGIDACRALKGQGSPMYISVSVSPCVVITCFIRFSSRWLFIRLHIWPGSSSQAELPWCPLGSLGSPEGQWEGCNPTRPPA